MAGQIDYRLLGPLEVVRDGGAVDLGPAKQRAVLAILLLSAGRAVSTDELIEQLWPTKVPGHPNTAIQGYVSGLRKLLGADVIDTVAGGYNLRATAEQVDLHRFEQLFAEGHAQLERGEAAVAAATCREALALWRGRALADFAYESFGQQAVNRLEELRLACVEERLDADLAGGRHSELVGELEALIREHPLRERLRGQLMLALYRSGRQAEALEAYQNVRRLLVDELGIEPGPGLQQLEREILMQDASLELAPAAPSELPAGEVTFLMTDVEGSTQLLHKLGDRYPPLLAEHRRLLRSACEACDGREVDRQGDNLFFVFERPADAAAGAVGGQRALATASWPGGVTVRVRMGVHSGEATPAEGGYVGLAVHRTARICAAAHGGQVILSAEARERLAEGGPDAVGFRDLGEHALKDLLEHEHLFQLVAPDLPADFPPPRAVETVPTLEAPNRSILLVPSSGEIAPLIEVAEPLARSQHLHELILARLLDSSSDDVGPELARASADLGSFRAELVERGVATRSAVFTSSSVAEDLVRLASEQDVDLVLVDDDGIRSGEDFGAELRALLTDAPSDVAILLDSKGGRVERPVLVPFGGSEHDWAALELASWLASANAVPLRLLGVAADPTAGRRDASRLLATASLVVQQLIGVSAEPQLVRPGAAGILERAADASYLVVGLSSDWQREGLGPIRSELVRSGAAPTMLVRRGLRPGGLAPRESQTRFTWSLAETPAR
jgi:DNA-binding SARP family transcriptional activator